MAAAVLLLTAAAAADRGVTSAYRRPPGARLLSEDAPHTQCANPAAGCSEQVHLALGGAGEMVVSWATDDDTTPSTVAFWGADGVGRVARGRATAYSQILFIDGNLLSPEMGAPGATEEEMKRIKDTRAWAHDPWTGERGDAWNDGKKAAHGFGEYKNPAEIYTSPVLHSVTLAPLQPGATYGYRVAGDGRNFSFTTPPAPGSGAFPLTLGLTADLGQTTISAANVGRLRELLSSAQPHAGAVLLSGDLSYADGYFSRWDSFGRMLETLAAEVPVLTTGGNHEIGDSESWVSYNARFPMPYVSSGSVTNLWWATDIGPAHVVALCSYAATRPGSLQYRWLERHLPTIDRTLTPWLVVMMHVPWYNTNTGHVAEAELMRLHMEPLLYRYGADLILSGHVHAYERHHATYKGERNPCGPVFLNLGDGGNREGAYIPWRDPQPAFSAFREASFGTGSLRLVNYTHALYNWTRSACEGTAMPEHVNFAAECVSNSTYGRNDNAAHPLVASDEVWIVRPSERLSNPECPPEDTLGAPWAAVEEEGEEEAPRLIEDGPAGTLGGIAPAGQLVLAALCGAVAGAVLLLLAQQMARSQRLSSGAAAIKVAELSSRVGVSRVEASPSVRTLDMVQLNAHGVDSAAVGRAGATPGTRSHSPVQL